MACTRISRSWRNVPLTWTRWNSSGRAPSGVRGNSAGGAEMAALRSAISACFQWRRSTCQVPSPISTAKPASAARVNVRTRRCATGASALQPGVQQVMPVLNGDEPSLEAALEQDRADERDRWPEHEMDPEGWRCLELDERGREHDERTQDQDHEGGGSVAHVLRVEVETAQAATRRHRQQ